MHRFMVWFRFDKCAQWKNSCVIYEKMRGWNLKDWSRHDLLFSLGNSAFCSRRRMVKIVWYKKVWPSKRPLNLIGWIVWDDLWRLHLLFNCEARGFLCCTYFWDFGYRISSFLFPNKREVVKLHEGILLMVLWFTLI